MKVSELAEFSRQVRIDIIESVYSAKSGHPGGSLSIVELLAVLYNCEMNVDPANPRDPQRDRFVLSKGHTAPALYATLARKGFFPVGELKKLRTPGGMLQGHPDMKSTYGVDMSTGSLGLGISAAAGMAKSAKIFGNPYRVYTILGDGELQEGQVWEALMFAAHHKLDNLRVIIDLNGLQIDGPTDEVMSISPVDDKLRAFGFEVTVIDGHDLEAIQKAFETASSVKDKPFAIIAKTVKGKGVSFMENNAAWHGSAPNSEQLKQAMDELRQCGKPQV